MNTIKYFFLTVCMAIITNLHAKARTPIGTVKISNASSMPIDTSEVAVYSFRSGTISTVSYKSTKSEITACKGTNVLLKAPKLGQNAQYRWKGPNGYTAYSSEIVLDQIGEHHSGEFEVIVSNADNIIKGIILLKIKDAPVLGLTQNIFSSKENLGLIAKDLGKNTNYTWLTADGQIFASTREVYLSQHPKGKYNYTLAVEKDGCEVEDTFEVWVKD